MAWARDQEKQKERGEELDWKRSYLVDHIFEHFFFVIGSNNSPFVALRQTSQDSNRHGFDFLYCFLNINILKWLQQLRKIVKVPGNS